MMVDPAPEVRAELRTPGYVWMHSRQMERSLSPGDYRILDPNGNVIHVEAVIPISDDELMLMPKGGIDLRRIYHLELRKQGLKVWCSFDGWFRELYSHKKLGANISENGDYTTFRIFSPRAHLVKLYLYDRVRGGNPFRSIDMKKDAQGVWEAEVSKNLKGVWYDFTVHGPVEPGNHFYESHKAHISDPYARVNDDAWGRSCVWPATDPAAPLPKGPPKMEDVIAYEVHVQDFTDMLPVAPNDKGCFTAFYQGGLKNKLGQAIGFDYLLDLGINVVHLLPVQEYLHYPDHDWKRAFAQNDFMQEMGIANENYQWGYRTSHPFAVEGKYRRRGTLPGAERDQFRDLVQAFHENDIAVIIDIVPNHTAEDINKAKPYFLHWNVLDKHYYYRLDHQFGHIGAFGNEVKSEERPMVQRWLIDQCLHWIEEFGVDGFRIDLAGQIDRQSLVKLKAALPEDIILYGEPWISSNDPAFEANPQWDWYKPNAPITFFQDAARDAYAGSPFNAKDRGYAGGDFEKRDRVKSALSARFEEDRNPCSGISYIDIHDNWALADRFALQDRDGRQGVDEDRYKIAALLLYTSMGPIVTHGGVEMMRSKGLAPLKAREERLLDGTKISFKGREDSYNLRAPNRFIWDNVGRTLKQDSPCGYRSMHAFWRGLNRFRLSEHGKVFRQAEAQPKGYYHWIDTENPYQLGYVVREKVLVLVNVGSELHSWPEFVFPPGQWKLIGSPAGVDHVKGIKIADRKLMRVSGGERREVSIQGPGFLMWVRENG